MPITAVMTNDCQLLMAPVPLSRKPGAICDANVAVYLNHVPLSYVWKRFCVPETKNELCFEIPEGSQLTSREIGEVSVVAVVLSKSEVPVCLMY